MGGAASGHSGNVQSCIGSWPKAVPSGHVFVTLLHTCLIAVAVPATSAVVVRGEVGTVAVAVVADVAVTVVAVAVVAVAVAVMVVAVAVVVVMVVVVGMVVVV